VRTKSIFIPTVISILLFVGGCATQSTFLKNNSTGQVAECGGDRSGSMMFGAIGYAIQQSDAEDCVNRYLDQGFEVTGVGDVSNAAAKPLPKATEGN